MSKSVVSNSIRWAWAAFFLLTAADVASAQQPVPPAEHTGEADAPDSARAPSEEEDGGGAAMDSGRTESAAPAVQEGEETSEGSFPGGRFGREDAFVDSRLTFTFGDDDLLAATGEQVPLSPLPGFGDRPAYELFFDNLNTRFSSRETLTHIVVYNEMPSFFENLKTEAALVVRLNLLDMRLTDTGSYIRLLYTPWAEEDDGISLVAFPFDSERFRLGYLYALSFGGADFVPRRSLLRAPGFKLQLDRGPFYAFLGMKTIPAVVPLEVELDTAGSETEVEVIRVDETQYSVLGGAGLEVLDETLRFEFGAGYFQQGVFDLPGYPRVQVYSVGGAARVVLHRGMGVPGSIDFRLYRNDPYAPFVPFRPVQYVPGKLAWMLSVEGVAIQQHLADSDRPNATTMETALAGAVRGRLHVDRWRFELTGLYRDLSFLLKNVPSLEPFLSIPEALIVNPELFVALTADHHFPEAHLTVGISGGVQLPATVSSPVTTGPADAARTLVVRGEGNFSILPPGTPDAAIILGGRLYARWDLSEMLYSYSWIQYVRDPNETRLVVSETEGTRRVFQRPDRFGFGLTLAARF